MNENDTSRLDLSWVDVIYAFAKTKTIKGLLEIDGILTGWWTQITF